MRSLTLRNEFWKFLEFDVLLIGKLAKIVNKFETVFVVAVFTICWLLNFSILQCYRDFTLTICASEKGSFHLGIHFRCSYYNSSKANEPVDVFRTKIFDLGEFIQFFYSHHQLVPSQLSFKFLALTVTIVQKHSFVQAFQNEVKVANHLGGKVNKLVIQFSVMLLQVSALNLKGVLLEQFQVVKLHLIDLFTNGFSIFKCPHYLKVHHKVLKSRKNTFAVDIGPIDNSNFVACQRICLLDMLWSARMIMRTLMYAMRHVEIGPVLNRSVSGSSSGVAYRLTHSKILLK